MTRVVLLAGPSGSGKSRLVREAGALALRLDDFYLDADHPGLPRTLGIVDWDDPATWGADAAVAALGHLVAEGRATVPVYDIGRSRRVDEREVVLGDHRVVIAEGIFAVELLAPARRAGLAVEAVYLDRNRWLVAALRLTRDLRQRRKPPVVLVRRGAALWRDQPALRARAAAAGFRPLSMRAAIDELR